VAPASVSEPNFAEFVLRNSIQLSSNRFLISLAVATTLLMIRH
jgi:hypothetical protein